MTDGIEFLATLEQTIAQRKNASPDTRPDTSYTASLFAGGSSRLPTWPASFAVGTDRSRRRK